jgi:polyisoprenoid-binding protein YceI
MRYYILILVLLSLSHQALAVPQKYTFDKQHTTILFFINHLGFSNKVGRMTDFDGYFIFDQDNPENSMVEITMRPEGIATDSKDLDKVLQGELWFNSKRYPEMKFTSSDVSIIGANQGDVQGWLTMLGKEEPITLHVRFNKTGIHPQTHKYVAGFSGDTVINRAHFGMDNYVPMVGEEVRIHIEVEGVKQEVNENSNTE